MSYSSISLQSNNKTLPLRRYAAALIIILFFTGAGCRQAEDAVQKPAVRPVKVITVSETLHDNRISLPGKTRAGQRVDLSFKVSGPLMELLVEEGRQVEKGQLIARIDPRDFENHLNGIKSGLSEARANLKSMKKGARAEDIKMLESALEAARAEYLFAEEQYGQSRKLWLKQYISRIEFDHHTSLRDVAKAQLEAASQGLAKARNGARKEDIEAMESRISGLKARLKAARDALDDTFLRAPFTGYVAQRYVENHQKIQAKQPVILLEDVSRIEIAVDIPETLMAGINQKETLKMAARFTVAPDRVFSLKIREFSTHADPQTQTYRIVLEMPRPREINILPGMTATVEGLPGSFFEPPERIVIPAVAVTQDSEGIPFVWRLDKADMTISKNRVKMGSPAGSEGIVILDGLTGGETIVTAGVTQLKSGATVSIWDSGEKRL